jgi:hypothetical protein
VRWPHPPETGWPGWRTTADAPSYKNGQGAEEKATGENSGIQRPEHRRMVRQWKEAQLVVREGYSIQGMAPPRSLDELLSRAAEVVQDIAEADQVRLGGGFESVNSRRGVSGEYLPWEERIYLVEREVGRYLTALVAQSLMPSDNQWAANALAVLNHELIHALGPSDVGASYGVAIVFAAEGGRPMNPGPRFIEEGITELWTRRSFPRFVADLELIPLAPWLENVAVASAYLGPESQVSPILTMAASATGGPEDEILKLLAREVPDTRSRRFASHLLIACGRNPPPEDVVQTIATIFDTFLDYRIVVRNADHGILAARAIAEILRTADDQTGADT